jgi:hypothetical protein
MADNFWEKDTIVKDENEWWSQDKIAQQPAAPASTDRTVGEAFKDVGAGLVSGAGALVQLPGQLYGLATGDFSKTGSLGLGEDISEYGQEMKSAGLKAREAERAAKVQEAEKEGQFAAFKAGFGETITDPGLFTSFIAEQVPNILPMILTGGATAALTAGRASAAALAKGATKEAAAEAAKIAGTKAGTTAAIQTGAVMQGADIGAGSYDEIYGELLAKGMSEEQAATETINKARAAGLTGYGLSVLANRYLPGGKALEEILAGKKITGSRTGSGAVTAIKEIPSENIEEVGGRIAQNVAAQQAGLDRELLAGTGETAAMATLGAIGIGGAAGAIAPRRSESEQAAKEVDAFKQEEAEFRKQFGETKPVEEPEAPTEFPGGYTATRRELSRQDVPESYGIFPEGADKPLTTVQTQEEAQAKLQTLTEIRAEEQARLIAESDKIDKEILAERRKLDVLEATGQTDTDQYVQSKAALLQREEEAAQQVSELNDRIASYSTPLTLAPVGSRTDVQSDYVVKRGDQEIGAFPTLQDAETRLREIEPETFTQAEQQARVKTDDRVQQLKQTLTPMLAKFGLQDVSLNIAEKIENDAGGKYLDKLINVSLTEANPVQTMRHESLHALKDLQFFTPQQWKALTERANKQWIKEYLQDQQSVIEVDGKPQTMSRLDAYKKLGYTQEAIVEEAIADAFGAYDKGATPPPGMIAALFKKLKNFFLNFGQALRGAGFESADDVFQRVERGELKSRKPKPQAVSRAETEQEVEEKAEAPEAAKPPPTKPTEPKYSLAGEGVPMSTRKLMEQQTPVSQQDLGLNTEANRGRFNNVRDIAKALNQQTLDQLGAMDRNKLTQDESTRIAEAVADEVTYQLGTTAKTGTGLGWYSNNYPNAVKRLGRRFPELSTNKHARSVFSALVAVTSNGERVAKNIDNAIKLYGKLRSGKRLVAMGNRRPTALQSNLQVIQDLLAKHGQDFETVLLKEITVKEMNARLREMGEETDGSYLANTVVPAAAVYFGPKLGAFYANLSGSEGYLTMDLWWTRSINRMRGLLIPKATEASINKFRDMMDRPDATRDEVIAATVPLREKYEEYGWTSELEHLAGKKEPAKKAAKEAWFKAAEEKAGDAYEQLLFEHNLEKMANTIYKNEYEMLEEAPFTGSDRKFMYDAARKAQKLLQNDGVDLSLADIQAALWYYEKRLYAKLSGRKADDIGYEEAIIAQANQGSGRARPSVVFDQKPDGRDERGAEVAVSDEARGLDGEKFSLRKGVIAEVAPNPDHISAKKWREMTPSERLNATKAVANRVVSSVFSDLDLKGYKYEFSTGTYEGEVNPNIIVQAPEGATEQEIDEVARVLGYVLDQKAMVAFDEDNKSSSDQAGFVKVVIPTGMSPSDLNELRTHITQSVPQADGDTLRDGELVYGNFSAYNDNVDTLTDKQYHKAIRDAVEAFPYEGIIEVSAPETFHSSLIWPDTRSDYLKETRYGDSERFQGEAGADVRGQRSRRLQAISEDAITLRDKWIDARGAARLGGRERGNAIDFGQPTEEYGTPTRESVSVVGVHFSKEGRSTLISEFHGTGLRGLEGERLSERENSDIRSRIYFYVDNGKGVRPEAGVGGTPHVIRLRNLYDASADPLDIIKNTRGENSAERASKWERSVKKAGFDGYLVKNQSASQDYAVLIGKHSVKTGKLSLRTSFPSAKEAENAAYDKAPPSTKEFKLFFGGSTIMEEGRPQPMYHGSASGFDTFSEAKPIFISPDPNFAEQFAEDRAKDEGKSSDEMRIYPLWVRAETPFDYENKDHAEMVAQKIITDQKLSGPDSAVRLKKSTPKANAFKKEIAGGLWSTIEDPVVQDALKSLGFDSFYVQEQGNKNLAVFKAEQVKSITGNIGDFSRESKDMRFSLKKVRYSPDRFQKLWDESMYTQNDAENKTKGYLAFVNPMEFVRALASPDTFDRLRREQEPIDFEKMRAYGGIPSLTVSEKNGDWKITGHEGRHRMLALYDDGYREVPVYIHLRAEDAKSIPAKALTAQYDDALSSVLMVAEVEPLSYANKQKALEKFTRMESKVKYSLPTIPQNLQDRMGETTSRRERKTVIQNIIEAITPTSAADFRAKYLNRYNQMSVYDKKLAEQMGGAALLADQSAESSALMSDLGAGVAASAMGFDDRNGGIPVLRNGITTIDKSVKGLIASLGPLAAYGDPAIYQRYQYWAMVKRGQRLNKDGKLTGIDSADVAFAKILEQKHPEFVSVQKDLIAFNNGLVQYMVDTGVLSKERGQIYTKYADYIPFYRQMDGGETQGPNLFQSLSGVKPPKKLKGAIAEEAPLADFLETMVRNTQSSIQAGIKNYAAQRALNVAVQVKAPGMEAERLNYVDKGPDIINVLEKGKLVSYRTTDTLLVNAMMSLNQSELPFIGFLSAPADLLRTLVTKEPGFMMANMLRDSLSAWVTSGQKMTPIAGTVINFGKAIARTSPGFEAMLDAGIIGGYEFNENVEKSGFKLEDDLAKKAGKKAPLVLRPFKSVWDALGKGTTASDAATRALIYERVLADTGNEAEALYRSLEVMNFHRKGSSPLIRVLTAAVPFFNARLQGLDLFYRASTGNMNNKDAAAIQRQFFARGMTMMALSGLYWMLVSDDEEYKKQEQETKDNNWIIPAIGAKIPIPFEVGVLFKVIPERIMAYSFGDDTGEDLQKSMIRAAVSTFAFNPIPQTVKPVLEAVVDYNMFTMRPILGQGMKDIEPEFQVGPSTSNFATLLAQNLGLSPMKVDHIIKGYTGTMGMYAIDTIDIMLDQFGDSPKPTKRFEQLPVIKRFASDPESRGFVTQYYELKDAVDTTVRTMNLLERTGQYEEYAEYLVKNQGTLAFKGYVRDTEKTLKDLREMRTAIRSSTMTGDEKRDSLLEISRVESAITANIQEIKKAIAQAQ